MLIQPPSGPRRRDLIQPLLLVGAAAVAPWTLLVWPGDPVENRAVHVLIPMLVQVGLPLFAAVVSITRRPEQWRRQPIDRIFWACVIVATVSVVLGAFSYAYWSTAQESASCFNEPLSRVDSIYFALTVFTTTGFGDIHASSAACRGLVAGQMGINVILVAVVIAVAVANAFRPREE